MFGNLIVQINHNGSEKAYSAIEDIVGSVGKKIAFENVDLTAFYDFEINVVDYSAAFEIAQTVIRIPGVEDVDVDLVDSDHELEVNRKHVDLQDSQSALVRPNPGWFRDAIKVDQALDYAVKCYEAGTGYFNPDSKINIALIDTGYTLHPEVTKFDVSRGRNYLRNEGKLPLDTLESSRPIPIYWGGHGTSCAGTIIGVDCQIPPDQRQERNDVFYDDRVNGILPNANLIPYRVSRNIISFHNHMADAMSDIISDGDIGIISMSHASLINKKIYRVAAESVVKRGNILVAAPGSHVFGSKKIWTYPAKYKQSIAPAASTVTGNPWRLTHGGPEVTLCAPGDQMYIPFPFKENGSVFYGYKWSEGSSFAVPLVAASAAIWRAHHGRKLDAYPPNVVYDVFKQVVTASTEPFKDNNLPPDLYGSGVLNVWKLLRHELPDPRNFRHQENPVRHRLTESEKHENCNLMELEHLVLFKEIEGEMQSWKRNWQLLDYSSNSFKKWVNRKSFEELDVLLNKRKQLSV